MTSRSLILILAASLVAAGCKSATTAESRTGRYGWARAAKPGELTADSVVGTYSCEFRAGRSVLVLSSGGEYRLSVAHSGRENANVGTGEWYAQDLNGSHPSLVLRQFPMRLAVHEMPADKSRSTTSAPVETNDALVEIGFNAGGEMVLGVGVDPDNHYYFAREKE